MADKLNLKDAEEALVSLENPKHRLENAKHSFTSLSNMPTGGNDKIEVLKKTLLVEAKGEVDAAQAAYENHNKAHPDLDAEIAEASQACIDAREPNEGN